MTALDDFKRFIKDAESGTQYAKWAHDNPGDLSRWHTFRDALLAGNTPVIPVMLTDHGRELIDAGILYMDTIVVPAPTPTPISTADEFRFGDPAKGFDINSKTSTGWERQAGVPTHVSFSGEEWYPGWPVVDCLIQPADPILYGQQRSQVIRGTDSKLVPGKGRWNSIPFKTNVGYKPQKTTVNPNFNMMAGCLHEPNGSYAYPDPSNPNTTTPQAPFNGFVCTMDPNKYPYVELPEPCLGFGIYGGIPSKDWYSKGKRFLGPVFKPGHLYVMDFFYLESSDPTKGQVEIWIDDVQIVPRTTLATTWQNLAGVDATLFFCLQNYRPAVSEITWDNLISWCGIRVGDTREAASFLYM